MTIKQGSLLILLFSFMNNFGFLDYDIPTSQPKNFVFNKGLYTAINGNEIATYLTLGRLQQKPTPVFKYTKVIEVTKDKNLKKVGTLGSIEKLSRISRWIMSTADSTKKDLDTASNFAKHATMNNAIYCDDVEQVEDCDGKLHAIGTIVYRTQDLNYCALVKEYIAQQKAAEQKAESVATQN